MALVSLLIARSWRMNWAWVWRRHPRSSA